MSIIDRSAPMLLVKLQGSDGNEYRVVTDKVLSFSYTDAERKTDTVKLTVDNSDLLQFDDPAWRKGGRIKVSWGYPGAMAPERICTITSVKGFKELAIEANGVDIEMNTVPRQRVFENTTKSDIAEQIAEEYGYGSNVRLIDSSPERYSILSQSNLTDAQFLRQLSSSIGFEFYVDFDGFHFHPRRFSNPPVRVLRYYIGREQVDFIGDPTIENDITARPGSVRTSGRDPRTRQDINSVSNNSTDTNRESLTEMVDVIDPDSGSEGTYERPVASASNVTLAGSSQERLDVESRSRFRRTQQLAVKMSCSIIGDPTLLAKSIVRVEGMGRRLSVNYYITEITHELKSDYQCNIKMVSDGTGGHSTVSRQVQGLDMINVQQSRTRTRSSDVESRISNALASARESGDADSIAALERAQVAHRQGGANSNAEVSSALDQVSRNPNASATTRREASEARGSLSQGSGTVANAGRVNRTDPSNQNNELAARDIVDPDTGNVAVQYEQGRNNTSRSQ